jgi:hypothetical protein
VINKKDREINEIKEILQKQTPVKTMTSKQIEASQKPAKYPLNKDRVQ